MREGRNIGKGAHVWPWEEDVITRLPVGAWGGWAEQGEGVVGGVGRETREEEVREGEGRG